MMKTIVAATDFSEDAMNACGYAAEMAAVTGMDLILVHVCAYPVLVNEIPAAYYSLEEMVADAEKEIDALKQKLSNRTGGKITIKTMVKEGDIIEGIKACCTTVNTYAVVMARNAMGSIERFVFGAKTVAALKKLSWPLITVPAGVGFSGIRNIGVACDFRDIINTLPVAGIKEIATKMNAIVHVMHVSSPVGEAFDPKTIEESGWFQDLMGGLRLRYHFIKGTDIEKEIIEFADSHHLDLLIIVPKKHDLLERLFNHSHSKQLILHAHVPVMAIHE